MDFYVYEPKKRGLSKNFATTNSLQIMVNFLSMSFRIVLRIVGRVVSIVTLNTADSGLVLPAASMAFAVNSGVSSLFNAVFV